MRIGICDDVKDEQEETNRKRRKIVCITTVI